MAAEPVSENKWLQHSKDWMLEVVLMAQFLPVNYSLLCWSQKSWWTDDITASFFFPPLYKLHKLVLSSFSLKNSPALFLQSIAIPKHTSSLSALLHSHISPVYKLPLHCMFCGSCLSAFLKISKSSVKGCCSWHTFRGGWMLRIPRFLAVIVAVVHLLQRPKGCKKLGVNIFKYTWKESVF